MFQKYLAMEQNHGQEVGIKFFRRKFLSDSAKKVIEEPFCVRKSSCGENFRAWEGGGWGGGITVLSDCFVS